MMDARTNILPHSYGEWLSNLREPFCTLYKLASAAKLGSDDLGWYPRLDSNQQPPD